MFQSRRLSQLIGTVLLTVGVIAAAAGCVAVPVGGGGGGYYGRGGHERYERHTREPGRWDHRG